MGKIYEPSLPKLMEAIAAEARGMKGLDRRNFLKGGVAAVAGLASVQIIPKASASSNLPPNLPKWQSHLGPGVVSKPYGEPSEFEDLQRRTVPWLTVDAASSISMTPLQDLEGIITPSGLVFERYHGGIPNVDPDQHRLIIHGLVERPLVLTMEDLRRFPSVSEIRFIECPANGGMEWRGAQMEALQFTHGMLACCEWTGIKLSTLLDEVGVKPEGKWVLAEGADAAGMSRSIPLEKALDDTIIAWGQNGEALRPEQGYPLRMLNPGWEGNTSVKWLRRLEIGDQPWHHREETSKYTDLMPDGRARRFSWVQEANSVITSPCPEKPLKQAGFVEIRGFAWSGRGKIRAVDISFDGGVNWERTELKGLVLSKALTQFSYRTTWDGQPWLLQSRAIDETGYVQPTLKQLRDERGGWSIYHKNSIHTWNVMENGDVFNVQIS
ncbi:MAG: sulfite dehydrogenase [Gammaproteobacteria bacterium]|nr:sulfite dehydrogenase [Gammaproteobacteria bacterium]